MSELLCSDWLDSGFCEDVAGPQEVPSSAGVIQAECEFIIMF